MSWLWKDKKTEQLKSVLHTSFEDDKKSTANRLTKIKNEAKSFKSHVEAAFSDSRVTTSKFRFYFHYYFNHNFCLSFHAVPGMGHP